MRWDGKRYNKYTIAHTDGTPLKGKRYFVLRLDSDDPVVAVALISPLVAVAAPFAAAWWIFNETEEP